MNHRSKKFIVAWDFPKKASGTFYRVLADELKTSHPGGDCELIQRSVAVCRDDFIASRLAALAGHFGANVVCFSISGQGFDIQRQREANEFVERVLTRRLHQRGRHSKKRRVK